MQQQWTRDQNLAGGLGVPDARNARKNSGLSRLKPSAKAVTQDSALRTQNLKKRLRNLTMSLVSRSERRVRKHARVRKKVSGTAEKPRLNVYRSSKHIYAQLVDDHAGCTLAAASSLCAELESLKTGANKQAAREVGKLIAKKAKEKSIERAVFDRGGYVYHGRIKELAEGAREGGLKF